MAARMNGRDDNGKPMIQRRRLFQTRPGAALLARAAAAPAKSDRARPPRLEPARGRLQKGRIQIYHPLLGRRDRNGDELEVTMPTVGNHRGGLMLCGLILGLRLLTGQFVPSAHGETEACKYFSQLPDDCAGAELRKFDNLRNYRYEEIDLFARDPLKKVLYVSTYNTTGQNAGEDNRDSAPKALAQSVDPKKVAKKYQALSAWVSPPRH